MALLAPHQVGLNIGRGKLQPGGEAFEDAHQGFAVDSPAVR